jgi:hypothetical protein
MNQHNVNKKKLASTKMAQSQNKVATWTMQKRLTTTLIPHPAAFPHRYNIVQMDV